MFPLKRTGQISRSRLRGFYFAKEWEEPIWQVVCQRMERAGLASCVPKNGKSRFGKLFDKEMKLRYSDLYETEFLSVHGDNGIALLFGCLGAE